MATKAKRARKAKATRAVLINFDLPLYRRLEELRRGTTMTALVRDLVMQAAQAEHERRLRADVERMLPRRTA